MQTINPYDLIMHTHDDAQNKNIAVEVQVSKEWAVLIGFMKQVWFLKTYPITLITDFYMRYSIVFESLKC